MEQLLGRQVTFKDTPSMLKYYGQDIRGATGYIIIDCGYGIVRVKLNSLDRTVTADLFRDIERKQ